MLLLEPLDSINYLFIKQLGYIINYKGRISLTLNSFRIYITLLFIIFHLNLNFFEKNRLQIHSTSGYFFFIYRNYFFNKSRISVSNFSSAVGSGVFSGSGAFLSELIIFTIANTAIAIIKKSNTF